MISTRDIEFINVTKPSVDYSAEAIRDFENGEKDVIYSYTSVFEKQFDTGVGEDIGGIIVYEGHVYDYENFVGWVG
jgi:hypothetical protein